MFSHHARRLTCLAALLLTSCTGGSDGDGAEPEPSAPVDAGPQLPGCDEAVVTTPGCGGPVEGSWAITTGCASETSTIREVAELIATCEGASVTITDMSATGTLDLADGTFASQITGEISADITVAAGCLISFGGCAAIEQAVDGTTCENVEGICNCALTTPYEDINAGSYVLDEAAGIATVTSSVDGTVRDYQYCAADGVLALQEFFDQGLGPILVGASAP